ncbi:MAG: DUF1501 domain-containing protein [Gemmatales bacterium]|nr:DUF1501 domain-containing protein [Gemmatales bacterium]
MLELTVARSMPNCAGIRRRDFLRVGLCTLTGLTQAGVSRARQQAPPAWPKDTSVIWLWLGGGPSHIETFDPKMDAPVEFRSTTGEVKTTLPGITFGGTFAQLAARAHRIAVVRSFSHTNSGHGGGTHWVNTGVDFTGFDNGQPQIAPSLGARIAYRRGLNHPRTGMPSYVKLGGNIRADGPAYLGRAYAPFNPQGAEQNLLLRIPITHLEDRRQLLRSFDNMRREIDQSGLAEGLDQFNVQALQFLTGEASRAFDLSRESPKLREKYGSAQSPYSPARVGECLLLARRLCEAGASIVTIGYGGWDHHNVNGTPPVKEGFEQCSPPLDQALAAFIDDIYDRGLDKKILLVMTGEFGRSPRIDTRFAGGRDHWAMVTPLLLVGGGLKMGQVIGKTTARAERPDSEPYSPADLFATIFHVLGIHGEVEPPATRPGSRPVFGNLRLGGRLIPELL